MPFIHVGSEKGLVMDWIKVKSEHISPEYSDAEVGALIRFQLMTASLKRVPTEKELLTVVRKSNWIKLKNSLNRFGIDTEYICNKVMEDVESILRKRKTSRATSQRYQEKHRSTDTSCDTSADVHREDKIRLDKIKEDKIKEDKMRLDKIKEAIEEIKTLWNAFASTHGLQEILTISDKRKSAIKARRKESDFDLQTVLGKIKASKFLLGDNNRGWTVDFDFVFCSKDNYLKILEGKYDDKTEQTMEDKYAWMETL